MLLFDDWLDGKLAIWLQQQTTFGGGGATAFADAVLYASLLFGMAWLKGGFLLQQAAWLGAALLSYALTTAAGLVDLRRIPQLPHPRCQDFVAVDHGGHSGDFPD